MSSARPIFDFDNHYYEAEDAFTRYQDRRLRSRGVRWAEIDGRRRLLVGGVVNTYIANPTFDPVARPGALFDWYRGNPKGQTIVEAFGELEPLRSEYRDRDARLAVMDEQGLDAALLFPTLGCGIEEALREDIPATMASMSAFNRWLEEDWGFDHEGRIIGAPMLSLADPALAVAEIESLLERGVRIVHVRPAPVPAADGSSKSLGDTRYDPVWASLAEASIPVAFHLGDSGYQRRFAPAWGGRGEFGFGNSDPLAQVLVSDRAIHDTIASLVLHGVFQRHPGLRVASIENGSDWIALLAKRLRKQANQTPWVFAEDPLETLRRHVWVTPYLEEDLTALAETIGVERILFGSDWPHGEGVAQPLDFAVELDAFDESQTQRILRDNCRELLGSVS